MRFLCSLVVAVGVASPAVAQDAGGADPAPSLEYRPPRQELPEPKVPIPAPPITIFREAIGGFGISAGSFDGPVDVAQDADGYFYVLDAGNNRVQKFDSFSNFKLSWGSYGTRAGEFNQPTAIAVSPGGYVYVVDSGNNRIQQFDREGVFVGSWGDLGSRAGSFKNPRDIAFKKEGAGIFASRGSTTSCWVVDAGNERVQEFTFGSDREASGLGPVFEREFGSSFSRGGVFTGLVSLSWSDDRFGYLYLLGAGCLVQQFQPDGNVVKSWSATVPGEGLCSPGRIQVDNKNDLVYVLDAGNSLLARFNRDGQFLSALRGADTLFSHPLGFTVNPQRDEVLVADTENNIVQKFTLR